MLNTGIDLVYLVDGEVQPSLGSSSEELHYLLAVAKVILALATSVAVRGLAGLI